MTHLIFLYLLKYKKLFEEGVEILFDEEELMQYGQLMEIKDTSGNNTQQRIF
jgi:hypothetical protein